MTIAKKLTPQQQVTLKGLLIFSNELKNSKSLPYRHRLLYYRVISVEIIIIIMPCKHAKSKGCLNPDAHS